MTRIETNFDFIVSVYVLVEYVDCPLSKILSWRKDKKKYIRRLFIDLDIKIDTNIFYSFSKVKCLIFGIVFNQPITKEVLPSSVIQLTFGHKFNHPITKEVLPDNLIQ